MNQNQKTTNLRTGKESRIGRRVEVAFRLEREAATRVLEEEEAWGRIK